MKPQFIVAGILSAFLLLALALLNPVWSGNFYNSAFGVAYPHGSHCPIKGRYDWKNSHPKLTANLCRLSRAYGTIIVTSSCRTKKTNRSVKGSFHLISKGCKAADLHIPGTPKMRILKWWARNVGGGRGSYNCRPWVHVDVGPNRSWHWNTRCKRKHKKMARRYKKRAWSYNWSAN